MTVRAIRRARLDFLSAEDIGTVADRIAAAGVVEFEEIEAQRRDRLRNARDRRAFGDRRSLRLASDCKDGRCCFLRLVAVAPLILAAAFMMRKVDTGSPQRMQAQPIAVDRPTDRRATDLEVLGNLTGRLAAQPHLLERGEPVSGPEGVGAGGHGCPRPARHTASTAADRTNARKPEAMTMWITTGPPRRIRDVRRSPDSDSPGRAKSFRRPSGRIDSRRRQRSRDGGQ